MTHNLYTNNTPKGWTGTVTYLKWLAVKSICYLQAYAKLSEKPILIGAGGPTCRPPPPGPVVACRANNSNMRAADAFVACCVLSQPSVRIITQSRLLGVLNEHFAGFLHRASVPFPAGRVEKTRQSSSVVRSWGGLSNNLYCFTTVGVR